VLLLNLGGPETLADVRPFLYNLFADPDIIRLPAAVAWLQQPIALLISSLRAPKVGLLPAPYASPAQTVSSDPTLRSCGVTALLGLDTKLTQIPRLFAERSGVRVHRRRVASAADHRRSGARAEEVAGHRGAACGGIRGDAVLVSFHRGGGGADKEGQVRASPVEPFGKLPRRVLPNPAPSSTPRGDRPPARARGCDVVHVALADDRPLPHRRRLPSLSPPRGAPPPIAGYPSWWCCRCTLNSPSPRPARRCVFWRSFSGMTSTYCPCHTRSFPLGIRCGAVVESRALFPTQPHVATAPAASGGVGRCTDVLRSGWRVRGSGGCSGRGMCVPWRT
jgi:hypothetical protein